MRAELSQTNEETPNRGRDREREGEKGIRDGGNMQWDC